MSVFHVGSLVGMYSVLGYWFGCIAWWVISWDVFHVGSLVVSVLHIGSLVELYSMLGH